MNKKLLIIIIAAIVVAGIVAVAIFALGGGGQPASVNTGTSSASGPEFKVSPLSDLSGVPQGAKLSLQTKSGSLTVNNFYLHSAGAWTAMDAVIIAQGGKYTVIYYRSNSSFEIRLDSGATSADQKNAESALVSALGVSTADVCKLNVGEIVLYDNGSQGAAAPLSFCSGGAFGS